MYELIGYDTRNTVDTIDEKKQEVKISRNCPFHETENTELSHVKMKEF
jgi:hypothetical protein